jgi:predicted pyridoxine 5'-phosphate oxidase superfamily flavin-nucleotide-binding protein
MPRTAQDTTEAVRPLRRPQTEAALRDDPVVWLSSVQPDGRPHVVPVWFHWDG